MGWRRGTGGGRNKWRTLLFTVGGESFYHFDFDPYTYVATFRRFILALQREVKNAYAGTSATSMAVGRARRRPSPC